MIKATSCPLAKCLRKGQGLICDPTGRQHRSDSLGLSLAETLAPMYVIDLTHYLDSKGANAPERGPARKMADFLTAVVAHASDFDRPDDAPGPVCFKCRKLDQRVVETGITEDDAGTPPRKARWHIRAPGAVLRRPRV